MDPKLLAITLIGVSLMGLTFYSNNSSTAASPIFNAKPTATSLWSDRLKLRGLKAQPTNVGSCDAQAKYVLVFQKLSVDHDIERDTVVRITFDFLPYADGQLEGIELSAYLDGQPLGYQSFPSRNRFANNQQLQTAIDMEFPSFLPSGTYSFEFSHMDKDLKELGCAKFDLVLQ